MASDTVNVRNRGPNPVLVENILIDAGQTAAVPSGLWAEWSQTAGARGIIDSFLSTTSGGKAPKEEEPAAEPEDGAGDFSEEKPRVRKRRSAPIQN